MLGPATEDEGRPGARGNWGHESERSMRDIYYVMFRHKGKAILVFLVVMALTGAYAFLPPDLYESQAKLLVRVGQESVLDRTGNDGLITSVRPSERSEISTEVDILSSQDLMERVVEDIGLEAFLGPAGLALVAEDTLGTAKTEIRAQLAKRVVRGLRVSPQQAGNIIYVAYRSQSPTLAQRLVSVLMDRYLDKHLEVHRGPGSQDFFAGQIRQVRAELTSAQERLAKLSNQTGIVSVEEQRRATVARIGSLRQESEGTVSARSASEAKMRAMRQRLAELPETVVLSRTTQNRLTLGREEPTGATETRGVNVARQQMESALLAEETTYSSLIARHEALERQQREAEAELGSLNNHAAQFGELEQEVQILEGKYRKYSENLEQARVDRTLETERISNVSVLQAASQPTEPVPRERARKLSVGLLMALVGAVGLAFVSEFADHSIKRPEDVESKLDLRTLASIPRLSPRTSRTVGRLPGPRERVIPMLPPQTETQEVAAGNSESLQLAVPSQIEELYDYETLPERLFLSSEDSEGLPRVIALTSCYSGEGVTTVASHLAAMLADHSDGRVLFVDANLRHPSAHRVFGVKLSPGLAEFLSGTHGSEEIIQLSSVPGLDVVASGEASTTFSRKSEFKALDGLLREWRERYRFVVLDSPAVRGGMFAGLLGSLVDGVVLVVQAERVRWEVVRRVHERLVRAKANVLGVALNKREFYIPEWLYKRL